MRHPAHLRTISIALALALAGAALAQDDKKEPTVDDVLKKVDDALFFFDRQEKLAGYEVEVVTVQASPPPGKPAPVPKVEKGAKSDKIVYDAATGKKKQTDPKGADVPPGTFTCACGPWTLANVVSFELELFAQPWSSRFDAASYDREHEKTDGGYRLKLAPKTPIGEANMLKPAITGIELELDKAGVPARGTLHLDQKMMKDDGTLVFHFADEKARGKEKPRKRIEKIENTLTSANLRITPALTFTFAADKSGFTLPKLVEFRVPGGELSGTLGNMDMVTFLVFTNLKVKKAK